MKSRGVLSAVSLIDVVPKLISVNGNPGGGGGADSPVYVSFHSRCIDTAVSFLLSFWASSSFL